MKKIRCLELLLMIFLFSCDSSEDEEMQSCNCENQNQAGVMPMVDMMMGGNQGGSIQGGTPIADMIIGGNQGGSIQGGDTPILDMTIGGNQGGSIQGGSIQGGSIQGGSIQGGSIQGGSIQGGSIQGGSIQDGSIQGGDTPMADMMIVEDGVCEASFVLKVGNHPELILDGCQSWVVDLNYEYDPDSPPQINGGTIQFKANAGNFDCDLTFEFTSLSCGLSQVYQIGSTLNIRGCSGLADQYEGLYHINPDQGLIISFTEINTGNQNGNLSGIPFLTRLSGHVGTVPENGISLSNPQGSFQSYLYGSFLISSVQVRDDLVQNANCNRNPSVSIYDFDGDGESVLIYGYGNHDCNDRNPSISSSAIEICDSIDNDCDGMINENILNCCGNGIIEGGEACDDGNQANTDACTSNCVTAKCGDGFIHAGAEICDDGNEINRDACTNTCVLARCGDGFVQSGVESCDDGNQMNTDGCTNTCQLARCGDGFIRTTEACDDGNQVNTDACTSNCMMARCGDGFVQAGVESCDDGNQMNTDGCTNTCVVARCGDGFVQAGLESCDDGNIDNTDTCHNDCSGNCGDGIVNGGEICDDGNVLTADACINCYPARCGDGFIQAGVEACDDGNLIDTDTCINTCELSRCGDGFIQAGVEACDDGNLIDTDSCTSICDVARCGDGFIQAGETCDDGNSVDTDTCRNNCQLNELYCDVNCPPMEMILIEAGSFDMGGNNIDNPQTRPIHNVQIRSNFYVGKTEVTVGQYRACVNAGQCSEPNSSGIPLALLCNWTMMPGSKETHPVNCVTWTQARTFAKWIRGDLLTEAQWEYVAKSRGQANIYPWGNTDPSCQLASYNECVRGSSPVCSTIGGNTEQGLCDMGGNVWEMVLDEYHNGYGGAPVNELAWCGDIGICNTNVGSTSRIIRGGSWSNLHPGFLETAYRTDISPSARGSDVGFRIAKSAQTP